MTNSFTAAAALDAQDVPYKNTEPEQALVRFAGASVVLAYVGIASLFGVTVRTALPSVLAFFLFSAAWIPLSRVSLPKPGIRRVTAMVLDQTLIAAGIMFGGALLAPILYGPAFANIGAGFRFGANYTYAGSFLSVICMTYAQTHSSTWIQVPYIAAGVDIALFMIPIYAVTLAKRLERERAELQLEAKKFREEARRDPLTKLVNRAGFQEALSNMRVRTAREPIVSLMCLDLDGFKHVNDTAGHAVGDRVLRLVAEVIRERVGEDAIVARLGGDEFAILQRSTGISSVERVAESLITDISQIEISEYPELRIGTSIGVLMLGHSEGLSWPVALNQADNALYRAKRLGKGRFSVWKSSEDV